MRCGALRSEITPLVGRDEKLDLLTRRWRQAKLGEGRVVLVSGEPGIGKSRLTAVLSQRIESEPHTRIRYFCSPHDQDSALYPFIGQLERAAGFARDQTNATKLDKLEALAIAREQGTRGYELRAATSLAQLWADQGRQGEARDLLAPVYDSFTEGFGTPDLKDAKRLFDQLA
jgi:hypothetical protein